MVDDFALMAHPTTIRLLVSIAAANRWDIKQADVTCAYLNADLPKTIYLSPPRGLESEDCKVMTLKKAVYGLATSGALWHQCFIDKMAKFRMTAIPDDNIIFQVRKEDKNSKMSELIVAIVVDDCMMTGDSEDLRLKWVEFMCGYFKLTYNSDLEWYLGVCCKKSVQGSRHHRLHIWSCASSVLGLKTATPCQRQWTPDLPSQKTT